MMETPGNILRAEREKQNKSVNGIADSLKIKAEYLEALEENRFHLLPAEVYTKAYLRLYAETLGLEGGVILRLYKNQFEDDSVDAQETVPEEKNFNHKPVLIIASLLIIVITAVILSRQNRQPQVSDVAALTETAVSETEPPAPKNIDVPSETSTDTAEIRDAAVDTAPAAVATRESAVETSPAAETADAETASTAVENGEPDSSYSADDKNLILRITATELTWISMRIDGEKRREWSMRSGDAVTVAASERFEIKVGNAGGTRLNLNNKDLGELGPHGKIIDIVLP